MTSNFTPGDHVVHPAHGPGQVVAIEERELMGETLRYVTMELEDMRVMVPERELEDIGIREPVDSSGVDEVLELLADDPLEDPGHRGRRRRNDKRIRSGDVAELAKVVRSLKTLEAESDKGLKHHDMSDLRAAMDRLVAELAIALERDEDEVRAMVLKAVAPEAAASEDAASEDDASGDEGSPDSATVAA